LDGTRTYLVGNRRVVVIDPGPDAQAHVRALVMAAREADEVRIVLTHGHADHAAAARPVADALGAEVLGPPLPEVDRVIGDGDAIETDQGPLVAIHTPGHTLDHLCFHWPVARALFAGDLLLGEGDTTWVAEYRGCVADYFDSLERLREIDLDVIYPAHGPPLEDAAGAIDRFEAHRRERVRQVEAALRELSRFDVDELMTHVYGDTVPDGLHGAAARSLAAVVDYVRGVRRT
jgi:glyoxylase-like metal-dependent hydrolase (beta-lactamase superfamily II)